MQQHRPHYRIASVSSIAGSVLGFWSGSTLTWRLFRPEPMHALPTVGIPALFIGILSAWGLAVLTCVVMLRLRGAGALTRTGVWLLGLQPLGLALGGGLWTVVEDTLGVRMFMVPWGDQVIYGSFGLGIGARALLARYLSVRRA